MTDQHKRFRASPELRYSERYILLKTLQAHVPNGVHPDKITPHDDVTSYIMKLRAKGRTYVAIAKGLATSHCKVRRLELDGEIIKRSKDVELCDGVSLFDLAARTGMDMTQLGRAYAVMTIGKIPADYRIEE